jgi:predicted PhzF superfamily epimerase YddE/YHI9
MTREINAPAAAFVVPRPEGSYYIRWFNHHGELNLCGHATLAASKVLFTGFNEGNSNDALSKHKRIVFNSMSGQLEARHLEDGRVELAFPEILLSPLATSYKPDKIEEIQSIVQKILCHDPSIKVIEASCPTGKGFENWLQVEVDLSNATHKDIKDLPINIEAVVSVIRFASSSNVKITD